MHTVKQLPVWLPRMVGALLLTVPLVFGSAIFGSGLWSAWVLGTVVSVLAVGLALLWLTFATNGLLQGLTMGLGMLLFVTPWVLNQGGFGAGLLASSILGAFFMLAAGSMLTQTWDRLAERSARQDAPGRAAAHRYQGASSTL
jgi:hypothetical protein